MLLKKIKIGNITLPNNVFLAPIAGFTDFSFRGICLELGAGLAFTELVSCKGLIYDNQKTAALLHTADNEKIKAVQIFGADAEIMGRACQSADLEKFSIVDINMGCPVPKLYKNNEGSALMKNFALASKIIKSCAASGKVITVKIRTGLKNGGEVTADFAKMCEDSGASMVTVHGRVRENYYSGEINFTEIEKAKRAVSIPVIANGGVFTEKDAQTLIERTGADGVMVARGALYNPFVFCDITGVLQNFTLKELILKQIDSLLKNFDDRYTAVVMRKRIAYYMKGLPDMKKYKAAVFECADTNTLKKTVAEAF